MKQRHSVDFLVICVWKTLDFLNTGIRGQVKARLLWLIVAAIPIVGLAGFINAGSSFAQVKGPATTATSGSLIWDIQCVDCPKEFYGLTDRSLRLDNNNRPHVAYGGDFLYYAWYDGMAWHIETVDNAPGAGSSASLALDTAGNPHISYYAAYGGGGVKYAHWVGDRWDIQVVDDRSGWFTSIALDDSGTPHISYFDEWSGELRCAHLVGGTWMVQVLDSRGIGNGSHGGATSIAVDNLGAPHISYYDDVNGHLKYAHWASGTWITQTVDNTQYAGYSSSLSLDGAGHPHIGYTSAEGLKYARWTGTTWELGLIDSTRGSGSGPSLSLDDLGRPHVGYRGESGLQYARWTGSQWITQTVEADGGNVSLALSSDGVPHISYLAGTALKYALWTGAAWDIQPVDRGGSAGMGNSLALDHVDGPHISYLDDNNVKYASWTDGNWTIQKVDQVFSYQTALALDNAGTPHIGYEDLKNQNVRYAYWNGNHWVTETVQTAAGYDTMPSLALSSGGTPAMAYTDRTDWALKYAVRLSSGSWWTASVRADWDASAEWGVLSSLAIDRAGRPHISYYTGGYEVKYAYNRLGGQKWDIQTVDYTTRADWTSLALDSAGNPHISYRDRGNDLVKYAHWNGDEWLLQTVDSAWRGSTLLTLDSSGNPVICYHGIDNRLRCARWTGSVWNIQPLNGFGGDSSLALDGADNLHLSFYDYRTADLKYAVGRPPATFLYLPLTLRGAVPTR